MNRGIDLALDFDINTVSFGHYTPEVDFKKFAKIKDECIKKINSLSAELRSKIDVQFTYDGMVLKI